MIHFLWALRLFELAMPHAQAGFFCLVGSRSTFCQEEETFFLVLEKHQQPKT